VSGGPRAVQRPQPVPATSGGPRPVKKAGPSPGAPVKRSAACVAPGVDASATLAARVRFLQERAKRLGRSNDPQVRALIQRVANFTESLVTRISRGDLKAAAGKVAEGLGAGEAAPLLRFARAIREAHESLRRVFEGTQAGPEKVRLRAILAAYEELDGLTRELTAGVVAVHQDRRAQAYDPTKIAKLKKKRAKKS